MIGSLSSRSLLSKFSAVFSCSPSPEYVAIDFRVYCPPGNFFPKGTMQYTHRPGISVTHRHSTAFPSNDVTLFSPIKHSLRMIFSNPCNFYSCQCKSLKPQSSWINLLSGLNLDRFPSPPEALQQISFAEHGLMRNQIPNMKLLGSY